jgi:hypothetical protein
MAEWQHHTYALLCEEILAKFVGEEIPRDDLRMMLTRCFGTFSEASVVPLKHLENRAAVDDTWLAELFHGPVSFSTPYIALNLFLSLTSLSPSLHLAYLSCSWLLGCVFARVRMKNEECSSLLKQRYERVWGDVSVRQDGAGHCYTQRTELSVRRVQQ